MIDYKTAAAYIRVSTDDQVDLSPASQLVEIRKWGAANGYLIPDEYVFVDEAKSGRKVTGRDDFRRLIATAKTKPKPFDAILLWKFSRFARNRDDAVYYKSILRKQLKIDVISIKEPIEEGKMGFDHGIHDRSHGRVLLHQSGRGCQARHGGETPPG